MRTNCTHLACNCTANMLMTAVTELMESLACFLPHTSRAKALTSSAAVVMPFLSEGVALARDNPALLSTVPLAWCRKTALTPLRSFQMHSEAQAFLSDAVLLVEETTVLLHAIAETWKWQQRERASSSSSAGSHHQPHGNNTGTVQQ